MMKSLLTFLNVFVFLFFSFTVRASDKMALLVAISDYPTASNWSKIHGENDLSLMIDALISRGFKREDIFVLQGKDATKVNIVNELKLLANKVTKGGFFVFHFSGHGQQVQDLSPNKDEVDGFDESLVPYDAPKNNQGGKYSGQNHLIDDEMEEYFSPIRSKLGTGGQLLLLIDACHSGTSTREATNLVCHPVRGTDDPLLLLNSDTNNKEKKAERTGFFEQEVGKDLAEYIVISATRPTETNQEYFYNGSYYGPLSFAFASVMKRMAEAENYQTLFDRIRSEVISITSHQVPTIEGNVGKVVGLDKLAPIHNYFSVLQTLPSELIIDGGQLLKIHEGTTFDLYPSVSDTTNELIARGTVYRSELFKSFIEFDLVEGKSVKEIKRAYIKKQNFGHLSVRVGFQIADPKFEKELQKAIAKVEAVQIVEDHPDLWVQLNDNVISVLNGEIVIDAFSIKEQSASAIALDIVENSLLAFAQTEYISKIEIHNEDYKLSARLIPVTLVFDATTGAITKSKIIPNSQLAFSQDGILEVTLGSYYQLEVSNIGTKDAYLSVLDIQPNGKFSVAIPFPYEIDGAFQQASDYLIRKGEQKILTDHYWEMGKPTGLEQYYIVATDQPIDLRGIERSRGKGADLSDNSFAALIQRSWNAYSKENKTRNGIMPPVIPGEVNIGKVFVEIVE